MRKNMLFLNEFLGNFMHFSSIFLLFKSGNPPAKSKPVTTCYLFWWANANSSYCQRVFEKCVKLSILHFFMGEKSNNTYCECLSFHSSEPLGAPQLPIAQNMRKVLWNDELAR